MQERITNPAYVPLFPPSKLDGVETMDDRQRQALNQSYPPKLREMFLKKGFGRVQVSESEHVYIGQAAAKTAWKCTGQRMFPLLKKNDHFTCRNADFGHCLSED